jgi:hypothetical protein
LRLVSWAAAIVVLAVTKAAHHANRRAVGVYDDHRVEPVGFARAAHVFEGFAGSVRAGHQKRVTGSEC